MATHDGGWELANSVLEELRSDPVPYSMPGYDDLFRRITELKLSPWRQHMVFAYLRDLLEKELEGVRTAGEEPIPHLGCGRKEWHLKGTLESLANLEVMYFEDQIVPTFEGVHVTAISRACAEGIDRFRDYIEPVAAAYESIKERTDKRIAYAKEEYQNRREMGEADALPTTQRLPSNGDNSIDKETLARLQSLKETGFTRNVAMLFFYYLFNGVVPQVRQAKLIHSLYGYSVPKTEQLYGEMKQYIGSVMDGSGDEPDGFRDDMEKVANLFLKAGLLDIYERMRGDLGEH